MPTVIIDEGGSKDLKDVVKVKFVDAVNPPVNQKVVLDAGPSVSSITGLNTVRAQVGTGDGGTGWVKVREINPPALANEVYVQLTKVTSASFISDGSGFVVLKRNGAILGEAHDPSAVTTVKTMFSLP